MAGISDFIQMATEQLGVGAGEAQAGAGALLKQLKGAVSPAEFQQVEDALPDAAEAMAAAPAEDEGGGGIGGLLGKAAGALGGSGGGAMNMAGMMAKAGIGPDKLGSFGKLFVDFLKSKLPSSLMETLKGKLGGLGGLLG